MDYKEKIIALLNDKELSQEQKEKLEYIFPELKENEDEKIRKDLIQWVNEFPDTIWRGHYKKDIVTWLEKQGEQKPQGKSALEAINEEKVDNAKRKNTFKSNTIMTNKELIKKLLEFPMDMEIKVDMHPNYPTNEIVDVGLDNDGEHIWITNYE